MSKVILLIFLFVWVGSSGNIIDDQSIEHALCHPNQSRNNAHLTLLSNTTYVVHPGDFCIVKNVQNLHIRGDNSGFPTLIKCLPQNDTLSSRGFGFMNVENLTIENVLFADCGGVIPPEALSFANNKSIFHFGPGSSSAIFCNHCLNTRLQNVIVTSYIGYAFFGLNLMGRSVLNKLSVIANRKTNTTSPLCLGVSAFICKWSGILIQFEDSELTGNTSSNVIISNSNFTDNEARYVTLDNYPYRNCTDIVFYRYTTPFFLPTILPSVGAVTVTFEQNFKASVAINQSIFVNNHGQCFGSAAVFFLSLPKQSILGFDNCSFRNNTPLKLDLTGVQNFFGSAITAYMIFLKDPSSTYDCLSITDTQFSRDLNQRYHTTPFLSISQLPGSRGFCRVTLSNISSTMDSSFLHAETVEGGKSLYLDMVDLRFNGSYPENIPRIDYTNTNYINDGIIEVINIPRVSLAGTSSNSCVFSDLVGPVVSAINSRLFLSGNITFHHNHGLTWVDGTAITLLTNSMLVLMEPADIVFEKNAGILGGAIFSSENHSPFCSIQYSTERVFTTKNISKMDVRLIFRHNSAEVGGNSIYIVNLYQCSVQISKGIIVSPSDVTAIYDALFRYEDPVNNGLQEMSSSGYRACICKDPLPNTSMPILDCNGDTNNTIYTYPGKPIKLSMIAVDKRRNPIYSTVFMTTGRNTPFSNELDWKLAYGQDVVQMDEYQCKNFTFNIKSANNTGTYGELSAVVQSSDQRLDIPIVLQDCPPGFAKLPLEEICNCSRLLRDFDLICNVDDEIVEIPPFAWIGIIDRESCNESTLCAVGFSYHCPFTYCRSVSQRVVVLNSSSYLCKSNRKGILCGKCPPPFSTVIGGDNCQYCSNWFLLTIPLYILAGLVLVILLFFLRLTLTRGTMNGMIFYANLLYINRERFLGASELIWLKIFIATINLRLGFSLCLYDGLDTVVSSHLAFAFPMYLWFIAVCLVVISRCSHKVANLVSRSAVHVLATLIHLSFSTLLASTVDALSFIDIYLEDENNTVVRHVWAVDGNVTYQTGGHLSLFIISIIIILLFLIPYTILLTGIKQFSRFAIVNRFRPLLDAYCAPYKDKWRFWFGARLWVLVFLYVGSAVFRDATDVLPLMQAVILVCFTCMQLAIMPFKSYAINLLDSFFMVNSVLLAIIALYTQDLNELQKGSGTLVGMAFVAFLGITIYHIWDATGRREISCTHIRRARKNTYNLIFEKEAEGSTVNEETEQPKPKEVTYHVVSYHPERLREPVMASQGTHSTRQ